MRKTLVGLLVSLMGLASLVGCNSFFGSDGYSIKDTQVTTDDATGATTIVVTYTDDTVSPLTITIPKGTDGEDGVGIKNVTSTVNDGVVTITISYTDTTLPNTVINVPIEQGEDGKGIKEVKIDTDKTSGDTTVIFYYTDGTFSNTITIPKGKDGVGIASITSAPSADGKSTVVTIKYTDSSIDPMTFSIDNPVGIESIVYSEDDSTDTEYALKITYSDGTSKVIMVPIPQSGIWLTGDSAPSDTDGSDGNFYLNKANGYVYQKISGSWVFVFSMKGTGSSVNYVVTFDANGGSITVGSQEKTSLNFVVDYGKTMELSKIPTPTYTGHTFEGWWTSAADNPNAGQFTDLTPITDDINLYARWSV